jgi:Ca2+-binding RTX toxin-like protein
MRIVGARMGAWIALLLLGGAFVPAAHAATVEVVNGTAVFIAAPGEVNDVRAGTIDMPSSAGVLKVVDTGAALIAGPGCQLQEAIANTVFCPEERLSSLPLVVWAGDRDDRVYVDDWEARSVTLHGQDGNDTMHAGSSTAGAPVLDGGPGNDDLSTSENGDGNPLLLGGPGEDVLTINELGGGTEIGGAGDDQLVFDGSPARNPVRLDGGFGNDTYTFRPPEYAGSGAMVPGPGLDTLDESQLPVRSFSSLTFDMATCPGCVERVIGSPVGDHITGDGNAQAIFGGDGDDVIDGGGGPDIIAGQAGDDMLTSRDHMMDAVGCDGGIDTVVADRVDLVSRDCEEISRRAGPGD